MIIDPYLSPFTKLQSKWIKDLKMNLVTLNLTEEKMENILECIGTEDHLLNTTTVIQTLRTTLNKWDLLI